MWREKAGTKGHAGAAYLDSLPVEKVTYLWNAKYRRIVCPTKGNPQAADGVMTMGSVGYNL